MQETTMKPVPRLFHISDQAGIEIFEPRTPSRADIPQNPIVWAVDEAHVQNYLLPRDCPRVTFFAGEQTTEADAATFFGPSGAVHVIAVEAAWISRIKSCHLTRYEFAPGPFTLQDATAGYWISEKAVPPIAEILIDDLLSELLSYDIELRIMPSLWPLCETVGHSTLEYSAIRMRNAGSP